MHDWNGTKHKGLLSSPGPYPLTKDYTVEEKLCNFQYYNSNELLKSLVVEYIMKLNKIHFIIWALLLT